MARVKTHINHFSAGEVSQAALSRTDLQVAKLFAEVQQNIFSHQIGKGQFRPGTGYLATVSTRPRLIPFVRAINDVAVIVLLDSELQVLVGDTPITRANVTSAVTDGDFSASTGWTITSTGKATATIAGGVLTLNALYKGGEAICKQQVVTSSAGVEHALRISVTRGPVIFRCGSADGDDDYITETTLGTGVHSLAFTPTGSYWVQFITRDNQNDALVDSIAVEAAGVMKIPAPWTTAQLREIMFDQSADVIFMANSSWQQRKIERRATRSWSVVLYESNDGPFTLEPNGTGKLTPSDTVGNITITSDKSVFSANDVGALLRLSHENFNVNDYLAGNGELTPTADVKGIGSDNDFTVTVAGTFVGTVSLRRGYNGVAGDFKAISTLTIPGSINYAPGTTYDDVLHYVNVGFEDGDYTSGGAQITFAYSGYSGAGVARITGYTSSTQVSAEVLTTLRDTKATKSWIRSAWSTRNGWPSAVGFFDGRLWWGGLDDFWGSESDRFTTFSLDTESGDAGTIQRAVATGGDVSRINWFLPLQRLIIGTTGAEVSVRSSSFDEPLTPTNTTIKDASTYGSSAVKPVKIDSRGIFVDRSATAVYALQYSFEVNDYLAVDLTRFNEEICGEGVVELSVQRQPEPYIWAPRVDGQCPILIYGPKQEIEGWTRFVSAPSLAGDAKVHSVCSLPGSIEDSVYFAIERTINGSSVHTIEKLALRSEARCSTINKMTDGFVFDVGPVSTATATHLANETGLVGWGTNTSTGVTGAITGLSADSSGIIALGATYTNVCVGLAYEWKYKSAKLAYGAQEGTALLQRKRIPRIGVTLSYTHRDAIKVSNLSFDKMYSLPLTRNGKAVTDNEIYADYDEIMFSVGGNWDTDSRVYLKGSSPYSVTLNSLVYEVETHED